LDIPYLIFDFHKSQKMSDVFALVILTAALTGCAHKQAPTAALLEGKPRIPVNQPQSAPLAPASTLSNDSGA